MKGQIALETIIVISFVLVLLMPLLYIVFERAATINEEIAIIQMKRAVDAVATSASMVGVMGPNGSARIDLVLPQNVKKFAIGSENPKEISATIGTTLGDIDVVKIIPYNVSGKICDPKCRPGRQFVYVVYPEGSNVINITLA